MIDRELKRGSTELVILALLDESPRHGYELLKVMEERSGGLLKFHIGSVYPMLHRLQERGWIAGEWETEAGRRRRIYRITAAGRTALPGERSAWEAFVAAVSRAAKIRHA